VKHELQKQANLQEESERREGGMTQERIDRQQERLVRQQSKIDAVRHKAAKCDAMERKVQEEAIRSALLDKQNRKLTAELQEMAQGYQAACAECTEARFRLAEIEFGFEVDKENNALQLRDEMLEAKLVWEEERKDVASKEVLEQAERLEALEGQVQDASLLHAKVRQTKQLEDLRMQKKEDSIAKLEKDIADLRQQVAVHASERRADQDLMEQTRAHMESERDYERSRVKDVENVQNGLQNVITGLRQKVQLLRTQLHDAESRLTEHRTESGSSMLGLQEQMKLLQSQLDHSAHQRQANNLQDESRYENLAFLHSQTLRTRERAHEEAVELRDAEIAKLQAELQKVRHDLSATNPHRALEERTFDVRGTASTVLTSSIADASMALFAAQEHPLLLEVERPASLATALAEAQSALASSQSQEPPMQYHGNNASAALMIREGVNATVVAPAAAGSGAKGMRARMQKTVGSYGVRRKKALAPVGT